MLEDLDQSVGLIHEIKIDDIVYSKIPKRHRVVGGQLKQNMLHLDVSCSDSDAYKKGATISTCIYSALARRGLSPKAHKHLSLGLSFHYLNQSERSKWFERWNNLEHRVEFGKNIAIYPALSYKNLYFVTEDSGVKTILRELLSMAKRSVRLDDHDYGEYYVRRQRLFSRRFSQTEIAMVDEVYEQPDITVTELASKIGMTPQWVSKRLSALMDHLVFIRYDHVPYSKIGIGIRNVLLKADNSNLNLNSLLTQSPFVYSTTPVLTEDWDLFVLLAVPENKMNNKAIEEFYRTLKKIGVEVHNLETESAGNIRSFDFYSTDIGKWEIPWNILELELVRIHNEELADVIPLKMKPIQPIEIELDSHDIEIISMVRSRITTVREIRKHLGIGQNKVIEKLQKLRRRGLIAIFWELRYIGLNESVLIQTDDTMKGRSLAAWVQRLPHSRVIFSKEGPTQIRANLPKGGAYGFTKAVRSLGHGIIGGLLGTPIVYGQKFNFQLWSVEDQCWGCPEEAIRTWFASVNEEIDDL